MLICSTLRQVHDPTEDYTKKQHNSHFSWYHTAEVDKYYAVFTNLPWTVIHIHKADCKGSGKLHNDAALRSFSQKSRHNDGKDLRVPGYRM